MMVQRFEKQSFPSTDAGGGHKVVGGRPEPNVELAEVGEARRKRKRKASNMCKYCMAKQPVPEVLRN